MYEAVSGMTNNVQVEAAVSSSKWITSQNMSLFQPVISVDMENGEKGGGDITVVGGSALLPDVGPAGTSVDVEDDKPVHISLYVVRKGDSLSVISKMFGVSINTIVWANDLDGPIKEGQQLVILPISGIKYLVKKGDTIQSLAKKFSADQKEIIQFNNLDEEKKLAVGSEIIIPDGEISGVTYNASSQRSVRGYGGPSYDGYYVRPILGGRKTQALHGYNGVDLAAPTGTPVVASASGDVIISRDYGWNGGYGQYIVIKHSNGSQTLYAHLYANIVSSGQSVVRGQVIGYVGNTGKSTGPHLHFEIRGATNPF